MKRLGGQGGFVTAQFVVATALTLVLLALVANLMVFQYARGVLRAALDEGVRQGSRAGIDGPAICEAAAADVMADLMGGPLGGQIAFHGCADDGSVIAATATANLRAWFPGVPDWNFNARGQAVREQEPAP